VTHVSQAAICPLCGGEAKGDSRVLSSRFDALWLWMAPCVPSHLRTLPIEEQLALPEVQKWLPAAQLIAGSDSGRFVLHQRLITKALRDLGPLSFLTDGEPFASVVFHEMVNNQGDKMSKSSGNGVTPDDLLDEYGADALRLALLHISPLAKPLQWDEDAFRAELRWCQDCLGLLWDASREIDITSTAPDERALSQAVVSAMDHHQPHLAVKHLFDALLDSPDTATLRNIVVLLEPIAPHVCSRILAEHP